MSSGREITEWASLSIRRHRRRFHVPQPVVLIRTTTRARDYPYHGSMRIETYGAAPVAAPASSPSSPDATVAKHKRRTTQERLAEFHLVAALEMRPCSRYYVPDR